MPGDIFLISSDSPINKQKSFALQGIISTSDLQCPLSLESAIYCE